MTFVKKLYWIIIFIPGFLSAQEHANFSLGLSSGYSLLGAVGSVKPDGSFPIAPSLDYEWNDRWHTKFEYEWIKTRHPTGSVNLHSFSLVPEYQWLLIQDHRFFIGTGLGYQIARFENVDTVRLVLWKIGPSWKWNVFEPWSLESGVFYIRGFDGFFRSGSQQFTIQTGIAFHFGGQPSEPVFSADADQDSVLDSKDQCTSTPFGVDVSSNGCPLDLDRDSIIDYNDFCPDTPTQMDVDEMGCPLMYTGRGVLDGVEFELGSPRMLESSKKHLLEIALALKKFPNVFFVVEGYASTSIDPSDRLSVSKARAQIATNTLISFGIPENKIQSVGYGDQYPLTDSQNVNDQILNDRIEIKWKPQP